MNKDNDKPTANNVTTDSIEIDDQDNIPIIVDGEQVGTGVLTMDDQDGVLTGIIEADITEIETDPQPIEDGYLKEVPRETVVAVNPTGMAGVLVTRFDVQEEYDDFPAPMFRLHEYYPPEDDVKGSSVFVTGEQAVLNLIASLSELLGGTFSEDVWEE